MVGNDNCENKKIVIYVRKMTVNTRHRSTTFAYYSDGLYAFLA